MLSFTLLGQAVLSQGGEPMTQFRSQKEAAILIYLAHTGRVQQREHIADLLWEGSSTKQALTNLRTAISRLRKRVGDALVVSRKAIALAPDSVTAVDSLELLASCGVLGQIDSAERATQLKHSLQAYQGPFLAGFSIPNAPRFDDWISTTREQIRREVVAALEKVCRYALDASMLTDGIVTAQRWLAIEPLSEPAHMLLMQLHLANGNRQAAATQYLHAVELLRDELGVEPSLAMQSLYTSIRPNVPLHSSPLQPLITSNARHNVPAEYDQFFGRAHDQQAIHARLDQPWCKLTTLVGQGGVGKTRLAMTVARRRASSYRDGAWFVELAALDPDDPNLAEAIAIEIAIALDLRLTGNAKPIDQLITHLRQKQLLLVLDNFELLLDGVDIVLAILKRCAGVQILVTSRELLNLKAEWVVDLSGLSYPPASHDGEQTDAVDLFVGRMAKQRQGEISAEDHHAISTICRIVEGLPLAIELAAALTRHASCRQIADQLQHNFDPLETGLRDVPLRHRSLRTVFDMSWQTLTPSEQTQLARLAIHRGGFNGAAAQHVAQADTVQLAHLRDKSLLAYNAAADRYTLHPVVRTYAAAKRDTRDPARQLHADHFLQLLARHAEAFQQHSPQHAVAAVQPDIDNVRLAWQTGIDRKGAFQLWTALPSLSTFFQLSGLAHDGATLMHATKQAALTWGADGTSLAMRAGLEQARFQNRLGQYRDAIKTIAGVLTLAEQAEDRWVDALGHVWWGESLWRQGAYDSAEIKLKHALAHGQAIQATDIIGWAHHQLGIVYDIQAKYADAHDHLEKACAAWRVLDNAQALSISLNSIGIVNYHQGALNAARHALEQALTLCEQIGDHHRQSSLINNLSTILTETGAYTDAQYYLQRGLRLAQHSGDVASQAAIYINLGKNHRLLNESTEAEEHLALGLQLAESIGEQFLIATALFQQAEVKRLHSSFAEVVPLYQQGLTIARNHNLQSVACEILLTMAKWYQQQDEEMAAQYAAEATDIAETMQHQGFLERAHLLTKKVIPLPS